MASIFKQQYTTKDPKTGKRVKKKSQAWYINYKTAEGTRKRVKGFKDKQATTQLAAKLEKESELAQAGIVDRFKEHRLKPLSEHLNDFRKSLGDTTKHAKLTENAVKLAFTACKFHKWPDISASKFLDYIKSMKNSRDLSQRTYNSYLKAGKQFCKWMVQDQRASESPLLHLKCETITERRRKRRPLEPDEIRKLLETTEAGPKRFGMTGHERAILYRLAVETGLRANELRRLKVLSFDFNDYTVVVEAKTSKNKKCSTLPLRPDTAEELKGFVRGKLPNAQVFKVPEKPAKMLKPDLADAGIDYIDESGLYADFHSLRHTTGSLLAASGVHPKVAQSIMRHSDINLTMSIYTHTLRGQEAEAVKNLPDLSLPSKGSQRATGTDDMRVDGAYKPAYKKLAKNAYSGCQRSSMIGTEKARSIPPAIVIPEVAKPAEIRQLGKKKDRVSTPDTGQKTNGRWGIRTHDPLIKSQLLCQLS